MIINHNLSAMFASRQLEASSFNQTKDIEKLSSGYRINRAGDDAAGLAVSEKMRSQIRGLNQAAKNTMDGISFIQTSEGYLSGIGESLQRIRELSIQAANGIYTGEDRSQIQAEVSQMIDEIDRIASHAQFNGLNMLTGRFAENALEGSASEELFVHLGANMDQRETLYIGTMTATALGVKDATTGEALTISNSDKANMMIGIVDIALYKVNKQRADLGAYQNRLEKSYGQVLIAAENLQSSESNIRDANMAQSMVEYSKNSILVQSSSAMLANANQKNQAVLGLLR